MTRTSIEFCIKIFIVALCVVFVLALGRVLGMLGVF